VSRITPENIVVKLRAAAGAADGSGFCGELYRVAAQRIVELESGLSSLQSEDHPRHPENLVTRLRTASSNAGKRGFGGDLYLAASERIAQLIGCPVVPSQDVS